MVSILQLLELVSQPEVFMYNSVSNNFELLGEVCYCNKMKNQKGEQINEECKTEIGKVDQFIQSPMDVTMPTMNWQGKKMFQVFIGFH